MSTGKKLAIAGVVVAGVTAYMAYLGASSSWQYYMTVRSAWKTQLRSPASESASAGPSCPARSPSRRPAGSPLLAQRGGQPDPGCLQRPPAGRSVADQDHGRGRRGPPGKRVHAPGRQADYPLRQQVQLPEEGTQKQNRADRQPAGRGDRAMTSIGQLCLLTAMICSGYAAFAAIVGARSEDRRWDAAR